MDLKTSQILFPTPLLLFLAPFCAGIAIWHNGLSLESISFAAALFGCYIWLEIKKHQDKKRQTIVSLIFNFVVFCLLGSAYSWLSWQICLNEHKDLLELAKNDSEVIISGHVLKAPTPVNTNKDLQEGARIYLGSLILHNPGADTEMTGQILVTLSSISWQDIACGDQVRLKAKLKKIRNYKTPGTFDEERWWASQGILVKASVNTTLDVAITGHSSWSRELWPTEYAIENLRSAVMKAMQKTLDKNKRGIAAGLLLGEKSWIDNETREFFAKTGTGHLIAVSGLHMAIISFAVGGLLYKILSRSETIMLRFDILKLATCFSMAAAMFYAVLTGLSPSAHRAMLMIFAVGVAFLADRPKHILNAVAIAAWALLLLEPLYLFNVSFQLSFMAVLTLVLSARLQNLIVTKAPDPDFSQKIILWLAGACFTTIIATIGTAPLVLWHFQRMSLVTLPANLVLIPLATLAILPALVAGMALLPVWKSGAFFLWNIAEHLIKTGIDYLSWLASFEGSSLWLPRPDFLCALAFSSLFILFLSLSGKNKKSQILLCVTAISLTGLGILMFSGKKLFRNSGSLRFHVLDVGQGLCQVVEFPDGKNMVIDTGPVSNYGFDAGACIVAPFLRQLGYNKLDVIMLTHPEADHIGGAASIMNQFQVTEIWRTDFSQDQNAWRNLNSIATAKGIQQVFFTGNENICISDVCLRFLPLTACPYVTNRNSSSLGMIMTYFNKKILITGDMEKDREECILSATEDVDVMVVPHHGSATSSSEAFIAKAQPEYAVFPAGYHNRFHHPAKEVLGRYEKINARILRTDVDGTISFELTCDGKLIITH